MPMLSNRLSLLAGYRQAGGGFVGPLDGYTADLAGAWLLFRGFSSYSGSLVRIRDTDDSSEQDVGYDGAGELAAYSVAGDAAWRTVYDQSGNGSHMQQSIAANQGWVVGGVVNNKPVLRVISINHGLNAVIPTATARTIYLVARKRSAYTGAAGVITYAGGVFNTAAFVADNTGSPNLAGAWGYRGTGTISQQNAGGVSTNWSICVASLESVSVGNLYINNSLTLAAFNPIDSGVTGSAANIGGVNNGNTGGDVDVAGMLIYNAAHDTTTRQAIQSILATRYGITLA
jgi:hypothetical protein